MSHSKTTQVSEEGSSTDDHANTEPLRELASPSNSKSEDTHLVQSEWNCEKCKMYHFGNCPQLKVTMTISEPPQDTSVDTILKRLLADVDDKMEFLGTIFNPKDVAEKKVAYALDNAKEAINRLIAKQVVEAILIELHKLYDNRNLITPEIGTSIFMVRANDIKEQIIALTKELEEK